MAYISCRRPGKLTKLALIATAAAAATIGVAATAHAEVNDYLFQSPSGNIACDFTSQGGGSTHLICAIEDYSYPASPVDGSNRRPCTGANWFNMQQGMRPLIICDADGIITTPLLHRPGLWTLGYGQSLPAGHFFRVSRESYELG